MPVLPDLLVQLQSISLEAGLLGLLLTASVILVSRDWRVMILALLGQYILAGLVLTRLVRPDIAVLKTMVGAFICPILFLSARQVAILPPGSLLAQLETAGLTRGQRLWRQVVRLMIGPGHRRSSASTSPVFRLFVALVMMMAAVLLSRSVALPGLPASVNTAVFWLALAGLAVLALTADPLKTAHGLFTALTGFDLFYATVERSLLLTGLWGAAKLLTALVFGYLIVVHGAGPEEEE
ncbi:MAG: hypothetical protein D6784_15750 [Chloroflexi bacterium]|nr:MAG: hypothetical protein D6784_15750 [Chloroflexota bacterium]